MYKKISIENFKGIKSLNIEDFKQFNLFIGKNNSLKTTLLEAIYISSAPANVEIIFQTNGYRNLTLISPDLFRGFFNNLDITKPIKMIAISDVHDEKRTLEIKADLNQIEIANKKKVANPLFNNKINFKFIMQKGEDRRPVEINSSISMMNMKVDFKSSPGNEGLITGLFITNTNVGSNRELIERMDRVMFIKQIDTVIKIMKQIEPKLISLAVSSNNIIYADIGSDNLMPVNLLSSSFINMLSVIISIMNVPNGILFIDNIENNFSPAYIELLWNVVFRVAKDFNVQIFATSSSTDVLKAYHTTATRMGGKLISEVKAYRMERKDDVLKLSNAIAG